MDIVLAMAEASWDEVRALTSVSMYDSRDVTGLLLPPIVMLSCVVGRFISEAGGYS